MAHGNLEIARAAALKPIEDVANEMGLGSHLLEPYGRDVMKVSPAAVEELA
ncbi:MAG: formate--tetrahydrofolate ligase, partial [Nocardioidaceae bacterium]|nr:formate--tetrahydrofolate ligase [Nocardioidaceae bacterium]